MSSSWASAGAWSLGTMPPSRTWRCGRWRNWSATGPSARGPGGSGCTSGCWTSTTTSRTGWGGRPGATRPPSPVACGSSWPGRSGPDHPARRWGLFLMVSRRFWLIGPAVAVLAIDVALTLGGQSAGYWAGNFHEAVEGNPLAFPLLARGPWVFAAVAAAWGVALVLVLGWWRHAASDWIAALVALGHAVGGSSWLARFGEWGWVAAIAYLAAVSEITRWGWRRARREVIGGCPQDQ